MPSILIRCLKTFFFLWTHTASQSKFWYFCFYNPWHSWLQNLEKVISSPRQSMAALLLTSWGIGCIAAEQQAQSGKTIQFYRQLLRQIWLAGNSTFYTTVNKAVKSLKTELTVVHIHKRINKRQIRFIIYTWKQKGWSFKIRNTSL